MKAKTKIIILGKIHQIITFICQGSINVSSALLSVNRKITTKMNSINNKSMEVPHES